MSERAFVTVVIEAELEVPVVDAGYLGISSTVEEHINKARESVLRWQFLVKQGATEPKAVRATIKVSHVIIDPKE